MLYQDIDVTFHVLIDESVTEKDKNDLKETICCFNNIQVIFYLINKNRVDQFPDFLEYGPTLATYYRLFLAELLPATINKVLYLDGDVIVRKSLQSLWNTDVSNVALAAVPDLGIEEFAPYDRLQYDSCLGYFNAGVLLINLCYWREHNVFKSFSEFMKAHYSNILFNDQDVLNGVFCNNKYILDFKYNYMQNYLQKNVYYRLGKELLEAREDPFIIHFSGSYKPWDYYIPFHHPFNNTFYKYQSQTKWNGCRIDNRFRWSVQTQIKVIIVDILRKLKIKAPIKDSFVDIVPIDRENA